MEWHRNSCSWLSLAITGIRKYLLAGRQDVIWTAVVAMDISKIGYSANFNDWVRVGHKPNSVKYLEVIPPQENRMIHRPLIGDLQPHWAFASYSSFLSPAGVIVTFDNAKIYPESGIVQLKEGDVISEFMDGLSREKWRPGWRPWVNHDKTKKRIKPKTIVVALSSPRNYYYWMGDMISKFYLLMKSGYWKRTDHFVVADILYKYQMETFNAFGIVNKILTVKMLKDVQEINAREMMLVPTNVLLGKWGCSALRKGFSLFKLPPEKQRDWQDLKRIYLSREDARCRQVENEDEVVSFLRKYGFKKVVLGALDVATQVHIFRNAEVIVGPHGSGFTNIASCSKGAKIIELFSSESAHSFFWEMSNYLGLEYGYISDDGRLPTKSPEKRGGEKDMVVNINRLEKILHMMQVNSG